MGEDEAGMSQPMRLASRLSANLAKMAPSPLSVGRAKSQTIGKLAPDEKIYDRYYWEQVLQETGDGGKVVICRPKDSDNPEFNFVMKIRSKESLRQQHMEETFRSVQQRLLRLPEHSGIIPMIEVLEDDNFYYLVMAKASGGSFFEALLSEFASGIIPSSEVKRLVSEILDAVGHLHKQGMLHRDIKPDNLVMDLIDDPGSPTGLCLSPKLTDFDHAEPDWGQDTKGKKCEYTLGTEDFNAPETFLGFFSEQTDLYSVGACLYLLMSGKLPYPEDLYHCTPKECVERMKNTEIDWNCDPWPKQTSCMDLCKSLLAFAPEDRVKTVLEAKSHKWFTERSLSKEATESSA